MAELATVVLDCRWLGIGGPGRTTELMLRGIGEDPPPGRWVLWGPQDALAGLAWRGTEVVPIADDPRMMFGQRHRSDVPKGDLVLFMHQQRPLRRVPSVTVIYDTIALRYGTAPAVRRLKRAFLRKVATDSRQILTISEHSRSSIIGDLGVAPERVRTLRFPFDDAFVSRVHALRRTERREEVALFIGGFLPHKNLDRLVSAFDGSRFRHDGGRLLMVGENAAQTRGLLDGLSASQRTFVAVRHKCSQPELDRLFATSLFLIQPSLEEGFGLPAWEAVCCGLPVCVSDGGALPEVVEGFADPFPAASVPAMTKAIDQCATAARAADAAGPLDSSRRAQERAPTVREFGAQVRNVLEAELSRIR